MNNDISIFPLGAGQEVGRSCILLSFSDKKRILLDCGVHMGYSNNQKYPNFDLLLKKYKKEDINDIIDIALVTHFHLDHCAALPILTEEKGYKGPIFASEPTKAIIPYMLTDYMNVSKDVIYKYTDKKISNCCSLIKVIFLHQTKEIDGVKITSYYAGHVLGAVMFLIEYNNLKVVYTGDYNTSADRHLRACFIDKVQPDVLISESTYGTVIRDWKKTRENFFMEKIKETFDRGGKVLIPVFALGRAQEFFVLIEDIWSKTNWKYPVYYSSGLSSKVHFFYKFFSNWLNYNINYQIKKNCKNPFDLENIKKYERIYGKLEQPMLVLATPGMLHGGTSMQIFKEWCNDPKNTIIIPGYCVKGTLGNLVLGGAKKVGIDNKFYNVRMEVAKMSFSAHADNRGILRLVEYLQPKNVVFVHGEKKRMEELGYYIKKEMEINCYCPKNFEDLEISIDKNVDNFYKIKKKDKKNFEEFLSNDKSSVEIKSSHEFFSCEDSCDFNEKDFDEDEMRIYQGYLDDEYLEENQIICKVKGSKITKECDFKDDMFLISKK